MFIRASTHYSVERAIARLQTQAAGMATFQDQISSGVRLSRPSAGPADYVEVRDGQARALRFEAFQTTIADMTATLDEGVAALQNVNQLLTRASEIAIDGANGATDDAGYAAMAQEVDVLIERLVAAANARAGERYLFGGTATSAPPFAVTATDAAGRPTQVSYLGADERARGLASPGQTIDTFYEGDQVFQRPGADVFAALIGLRDELRDPSLDHAARSQALTQRLAGLQEARDVVLGTVGEQAAALESMQAMTNRLGDLRLVVQQRTADLEGTDIAAAIVHLREMENLYQATLGVTARLFESNFMDFVR